MEPSRLIPEYLVGSWYVVLLQEGNEASGDKVSFPDPLQRVERGSGNETTGDSDLAASEHRIAHNMPKAVF